ncbi:MAG: amidase [Myxococcales bacterium]|nr:amidase [Myxococcales bacterium]
MEIHQLSAVELLAGLERRDFTSVEAVRALIARTEQVDGRLNALVQRRFDVALREAADADAVRAQGKAGPLCGLPITVKDNLDLTGTETTLGVTARSGKMAERDAVTVERVRRAGAVVLGKTNIPQLLLAQETENARWGVTRNPWHGERTPGGSSGGEAAAIAAGISPLGLGSDIGGSIRIPCHFTGVAGLKPTVDRWSNRGMHGAVPGQELVRSQLGPMARTVGDLIALWRVLDPVEMATVDPFVAPLPADDPGQIEVKGLRIGWYEDDGHLTPTSSIRRAVGLARKALEAAGATLVPYQPPDRGEVVYLWLAAITSDGGRTYERVLAGEPFGPQLKPSRILLALPGPARAMLALVAERMGDRRFSRVIREAGEKSVQSYWDLVARRTEMRRLALDAWNREQLDAVICPPHATPAMGHRESGDFALALSYMFRYSLLNFPAGVVPVTRVAEADLGQPRAGGDRLERKQNAIDAASLGLPVGVQVVARPYCDATALAVMAAVEAGVRSAVGWPRTPIEPMP